MTETARLIPEQLLQGEQVSLRPVEADDIATLHRWRNDPAMQGHFEAPQPMTLDSLRRAFLERPALGEEGGELMIVTAAGLAVGTVQYHRVWYGSHSPAFNMGITIAADQRGHGYGAEAQRLMADYLLYTFPVGRVEAGTDIENIPEQRALEKAGFLREGVARAASWRDGRWHDMFVYSRVRGDA